MNYTTTDISTDAVAVTEMMTFMCSCAFVISLGMMLCTIIRSNSDDKMHWYRSGYHYRIDTSTLSDKERTFLLRPRPLFSRTVDGCTEWRYRIHDEWVYPSTEALAAAKM